MAEDATPTATLFYAYDPMCSWCWAFRPAWAHVRENLPSNLAVRYLLGGLAPDTREPMPLEMRTKLQGIWKKIQTVVPGTEFNFAFWDRNTPRRSTYAACRAVIAARRQRADAGEAMILAIQTAYYRQARNPADRDVLVELAGEIGLDSGHFAADLDADSTQMELAAEVDQTRRLGVQGFPSLVLERAGHIVPIPVDYQNPAAILASIHALHSP